MKKFLVLLFVCVCSIKGSDNGEYQQLVDVNDDDSKEAAHLDTFEQNTHSFHISTPSSVTAVQYAPNGSTIAYGLYEGTVRTVDPQKPMESTIVERNFNKGPLSWSPGSAQLVYGRINAPLVVYDTSTYKVQVIATQDLNFDPAALDWSSDNKYIAFCGGVVGFINVADHKVTKWRGHEGNSTVVRCSPYSSSLASGAVDKVVNIWDVESQECKHRFAEHRSTITALDWNPKDVNQVASGSKDTTVKLWDMRSNKCIRTLDRYKREITALQYQPNDKLVTGSRDGTVRLWDLRTYAAMVLAEEKRGITALSIHPNGSPVVYGSWDAGLSAIGIPDEESDELKEDAIEISLVDNDVPVASDGGRCCVVM